MKNSRWTLQSAETEKKDFNGRFQKNYQRDSLGYGPTGIDQVNEPQMNDLDSRAGPTVKAKNNIDMYNKS